MIKVTILVEACRKKDALTPNHGTETVPAIFIL